MKKNIHILLLPLLLLVCMAHGLAQTNAGDKLFESYLYSEAIYRYEGIKN